MGVADEVVVQPGHAGGARDAAEPHQRHPLHVGTQPQHRGDPGVQRGYGEPGDGGA